MKQFSLLAACLTALLSGVVSGHPGHGNVMAAPRAVLNGTSGGTQNSTNDAAEDNIPIFKPAVCDCPPVLCDSRMNEQSVRPSSHDPTPPPPPAGEQYLVWMQISLTLTTMPQQCECKSQALLACFLKSDGACPKPADNVCSRISPRCMHATPPVLKK